MCRCTWVIACFTSVGGHKVTRTGMQMCGFLNAFWMRVRACPWSYVENELSFCDWEGKKSRGGWPLHCIMLIFCSRYGRIQVCSWCNALILLALRKSYVFSLFSLHLKLIHAFLEPFYAKSSAYFPLVDQWESKWTPLKSDTTRKRGEMVIKSFALELKHAITFPQAVGRYAIASHRTEFPLPFSRSRMALPLRQCLAVFFGRKLCSVYTLWQSASASCGVCRLCFSSKDVDKLFTLST